jgi:hypothetical protein
MQNFDTKQLLKNAIPHFIAIVALYIVAALFYAPAFDSKSLNQGDTANYIGMSHEALSYEGVDGERPAWTDSMFGGMPTIQISGTGQMTLSKYIWLFLRMIMHPEVMTLFMAMLSAYVLALCLRAPPLIAFIVGATFGLGSINTLYLAAGHATKVRAIAMMPGILGGVITAFRGRRWLGVGIAALFTSIHLDANHLQMTYYLLFLLAAIGMSELIYAFYKGQIKSALITSSLLIVAAIVALLPSAPNLYLTKNYSHHTTRGEAVLPLSEFTANSESGLDKEYILEYSMAKGEWISMMVPNVKGGTESMKVQGKDYPSYWGEQRFSGGAFYFGSIAFALMLAFFFFSKDRIRWPLLVITILSIILSWRDASFISEFFIDHFPLFNKFRDTKMMLVLVQLCVATSLALSLKQVWEAGSSSKWKPVIFSLAGVVAILSIIFILPVVFFDFNSSIRADQLWDYFGGGVIKDLRVSIFRLDMLRSVGLISIAALALFLIMKGLVNRKIVMPILALIMVADLFFVDMRYMSDRNWISNLSALFPHNATPEDLKILGLESKHIEGFDTVKRQYLKAAKEKLGYSIRKNSAPDNAASFSALNSLTHYRVINWSNPFNDARTSYFHKSIGGYHGAKLRRYQDFISHILYPEMQEFARINSSDNSEAERVLHGLSMLNTKYILNGTNLPPNIPEPHHVILSSALGPAWMVHDVKWVTDAETELNSIRTSEVSRTAIVHEEFKSLIDFPMVTELDSSVTSSVKVLNYHPEGSTYEVTTTTDGLLVLSEIWYAEGWSATVNGQATELVRANYILRALPVSSGTSEVVLSYTPPGAQSASLLSYAGSVFLFCFLMLSFFMSSRQKNEDVEA